MEIIANNGRYGPYVQKGKDYRNIDQRGAAAHHHARRGRSQIFCQPKVFRRGGGANMAAKGPLREFGNDPVSSKPVVAKDGKFGVYVTDGETNASLSKGDRLEAMLPERAYELLAIRREAIIEKGGAPGQEGRGHQEGRSEEGRTGEEGRRQEGAGEEGRRQEGRARVHPRRARPPGAGSAGDQTVSTPTATSALGHSTRLGSGDRAAHQRDTPKVNSNST